MRPRIHRPQGKYRRWFQLQAAADRKLSDEQIAKARELAGQGVDCATIAREMGVNPTTIQGYVHRDRTRGFLR